ncbi:MAG: hypothetical protein P1S60_13935 [Anaerolineae bacterium]|nr:hypothetical protein [Anaerolineae bacterium]
MLPYDPTPWLMRQEGLPAVRARRQLGLCSVGDSIFISAFCDRCANTQAADGSFISSVMNSTYAYPNSAKMELLAHRTVSNALLL